MATHILQNAHNISITNPHFVDNSTVNNYATSGLDVLLDASIPEAAHDSSARDPPPRCHPGTRQDYIDVITRWSLNKDKRSGRILWMHGPAGVGKSAVAQSCAEILGENLGASFFFSKPNSRHDPNRLFTSISYQLATKIDSYRDILDNKIRRNPTLVTKSIKQQFDDLIASPFQELRARGQDVGELLVIIDGLDECTNKVPCDIIEAIATSVQDETTSLLWAFFTRPEPSIVIALNSPRTKPLSFHLELPVSREIDSQISRYLTDELRSIQKEHGLPSSWISDRDIGTLINLSAGLFIYAATVIRFVGERDSSSPKDQLRAVLALAKHSAENNSNHPLSELDLFYTLIMQRIPSKILPTAQKILLSTTFSRGTEAVVVANLLGLSESQFRNVCRFLHPVLTLQTLGPIIHFYHASFMEFLCDSTRSKQFCITGIPAHDLRRELLEKITRIHSSYHTHEQILAYGRPRSDISNIYPERSIEIPLTWDLHELDGPRIYLQSVLSFFRLCQSLPLDVQIITALTEFKYNMIPIIWDKPAGFFSDELTAQTLMSKIPKKFVSKIINPYPKVLFHPDLLTKPENAVWKRPYVLGHGKNRALCWELWFGGSVIGPCPANRRSVATAVKIVKCKFLKPGTTEAE